MRTAVRAPKSTHRVARGQQSSLLQARGGQTQGEIRNILLAQGTIGNRAVLRQLGTNTGFVNSSPQMGKATNPTKNAGREPIVQRSKKAAPKLDKRALGRGLESRVDRVNADATKRHKSIVRNIELSVAHTDDSVANLNVACDQYEMVYDSVKARIKRGEGEVAEAKAFAGLILGVVIGTTVGLGLAAVVKLAQAARKSTEVFVEISGEVAEWGIGRKVEEARANPGHGDGDALLEHANPLLQRLNIYRDASDLYRELALLGARLGPLNDIANWCGTTKADCRELSISGKLKHLSVGELEKRVLLLERASAAAAQIDTLAKQAADRAASAAASAEQTAKDINPTRMEIHLWLKWMSALSGDETEILDAPAVQSRLEELSIMDSGFNASKIGWNVGDWLSNSEQEEGASIAGMYARALRFIGTTGVITEARQDVGEHIATTGGTIEFKNMPWYYRSFNVIVDEYASVGDEVRVTHLVGGHAGRPTLYGRLVNSTQTDKYFADREKWRSGQLL